MKDWGLLLHGHHDDEHVHVHGREHVRGVREHVHVRGRERVHVHGREHVHVPHVNVHDFQQCELGLQQEQLKERMLTLCEEEICLSN